MTPRQSELFEKPPRTTRGVLMHVIDAGANLTGPGLICQLQCRKCEHKSEWFVFATVTEAKRGLPCPRCNA
ncbi:MULTISPECIES: hypothetical protein [unclassified Bradyrhizobium]|uniref:hypothetical protein n=1 Tax=unclassified Bradyrhizobium TaxID=2631580 RepID=UPI002916A62D|nr:MULTISPECIES: hypothetical protein [unclassified Bradyrhizobium]